MFNNHVIINKIHCFGIWDIEEGGCFLAGHYTHNDEPFEDFWDGDDCTTWSQAIKVITNWADRVGITLEEITTDNPNN